MSTNSIHTKTLPLWDPKPLRPNCGAAKQKTGPPFRNQP